MQQALLQIKWRRGPGGASGLTVRLHGEERTAGKMKQLRVANQLMGLASGRSCVRAVRHRCEPVAPWRRRWELEVAPLSTRWRNTQVLGVPSA